jgi:predicted 2-oxoglutarate/Fe(II)-dependent dioxygenase YbiX
MSFMKSGIELAPCIYMFENVINNCEEIIFSAQEKYKSDEFIDATVFSDEQNKVSDKKVREAKVLMLSPTYSNHFRWWQLSQKIWQYGNDYALYHSIYFSDMEFPQFLHYKKNEGFYKPHYDTGTTKRIFSAVLYLNEVSEGGETHFEKFDISVSPKPGRMILFPANFAYLHGAKTPKSNDKFAIVTWFNP